MQSYQVEPGGIPSSVEDEISLYDLLNILLVQKWLILSVTAVVTAVAVTYALLSPRIYRATVIMAPAQEEEGATSHLTQELGGLASVIGVSGIGGGGSGNQTDIALATLNSRAFTDRFLQETGVVDRLVDGADGGTSPLWRAYKRFDTDVRHIDVDGKQGVIRLSIDWTDPDEAAKWANELVARLNLHIKQAAIEKAEKSVAYLQKQLETTSVVELRQSIFHLIEAQINKIMLANVNDDFVFKVIDPAKPPEEPIAPKRRLIVLIGVMLGLLTGCFVAFIRHGFRVRLSSRHIET